MPAPSATRGVGVPATASAAAAAAGGERGRVGVVGGIATPQRPSTEDHRGGGGRTTGVDGEKKRCLGGVEGEEASRYVMKTTVVGTKM